MLLTNVGKLRNPCCNKRSCHFDLPSLLARYAIPKRRKPRPDQDRYS